MTGCPDGTRQTRPRRRRALGRAREPAGCGCRVLCVRLALHGRTVDSCNAAWAAGDGGGPVLRGHASGSTRAMRDPQDHTEGEREIAFARADRQHCEWIFMRVTTSSSPASFRTGVSSNSSTGHYAGFLSYSHSVDEDLAPALQTSLEQFGRVWYRRRALRIFRDTANLAATPDLWNSIQQALARSDWFILLASPESARSIWVRREVDWWLTNRSPARVIVVVTAGLVAWDEATGLVDERRTDALPPAFAERRLPEPLWVDLRTLRAAESADPAYQAAVIDIAATLHGRPKDDLVGEQIHQHRKRRRWIAAAAMTLVLLTLTSVITAGVAVTQRSRAEEQTRIATARLLLSQAQAAIATDPRTALLLGEAAQHIDPNPETRSGLAHLPPEHPVLRHADRPHRQRELGGIRS